MSTAYFTPTNTQIKAFKNSETSSPSSSQLIMSLASILIATSSLSSPSTFTPKPEIPTQIEQSATGMYSFNTSQKSESLIFRNPESIDDTISMNNETLEVEDLAEKITQAQLEEVKAHFDTKLSSTKTEVLSETAKMIEAAKNEIIHVFNEKDAEKKDKKYFWLSNFVLPLIVAIGAVGTTIWATIHFQLF